MVQLVAETVVDLLNDDRRTAADAEILGRALDRAVVRGHTVLHQLMRGESILPGEWDYLAAFRRRSTQPPPAHETVAGRSAVGSSSPRTTTNGGSGYRSWSGGCASGR